MRVSTAGSMDGLSRAHDYRLGFRADIEGLRAVAILLVVAAHAGVPWLQGGFVGVDVFFVLSGYLITGLLVQEIQATGRLRLLDFYVRRLRRLLPALVVMVIGSSLLAAALLAPFEQVAQARAATAAVIWLSNLHFIAANLDYFGATAESNIFLHTWSLGVEEQFYLVWPLLVLFLVGGWHWQPAGRQWRRLRTGMVAAVALCLALSIFLTYTQPAKGFYLMPSRAWQFALGAVAVLIFRTDSPAAVTRWLDIPEAHKNRWRNALGLIGLTLVLGAGYLLDRRDAYPGAWALAPSVGAALILAAGAGGAAHRVGRLLSAAPLQWLGRVSYSWYLWHWPVLILGATVTLGGHSVHPALLVLFSLVLALASYYWVESPLRRSRLIGARPLAGVLGAVVIMLVGVLLGGRWQAAAADWALSPAQQRYAAVRADLPRLYAVPGCDEWFRSSQLRVCGFGSAEGQHTVLLLGDSVTMQWFPAVVKAYGERGWRVLVITKSACPMVDEGYFYPRIGRRYVECEHWRNAALGAVTTLRPDVVLTGSTTTYPFTKAEWVGGSRRVFETLSAAAGEVRVLRATPTLSFDGPGCLARSAWRTSWLPPPPPCEAPAQNAHADAIFGWLGEAARIFPNVRVVDMNALVCPNRSCRAERAGEIVFRDSMHVTARYIEAIAPAFAQAVGQAD